MYRIVTDNRITLVLAGDHANHIRNNEHLSFGPITAEVSEVNQNTIIDVD